MNQKMITSGNTGKEELIVVGARVVFGLFQYGKGRTTSQLKVLTGDVVGQVLCHSFTVTDAPNTPTETVRIALLVENGGAAAVSHVKARLE